MTTQEKDRIECAIRHIKTATDVDEWAMEIAVEAMEKQIPVKTWEYDEDTANVMCRCPECGGRLLIGLYQYINPYRFLPLLRPCAGGRQSHGKEKRGIQAEAGRSRAEDLRRDSGVNKWSLRN